MLLYDVLVSIPRRFSICFTLLDYCTYVSGVMHEAEHAYSIRSTCWHRDRSDVPLQPEIVIALPADLCCLLFLVFH